MTVVGSWRRSARAVGPVGFARVDMTQKEGGGKTLEGPRDVRGWAGGQPALVWPEWRECREEVKRRWFWVLTMFETQTPSPFFLSQKRPILPVKAPPQSEPLVAHLKV